MSDKEFLNYVQQAMEGDQEAFIKICEKKGTDILYIAISLMGNVQDGEDAAQEILLNIHKGIRNLKNPEAFHSWMYRIARNVCTDMIKRKARAKEFIVFEDYEFDVPEERLEFLPQEYLEDHKKKEVLLEVIRDLPMECKVCVLMFYFNGMNYAEIADSLEISKKDVDNRLMRAKRLIRSELNKKQRAKDVLDTNYGIAGVPVLAQILRSHAGEVVTGDMSGRFLAYGNELAGNFLAGAAGEKGEHNEPGKSSGRPGQTPHIPKAWVLVAVAAGITAGVIGYQNRSETRIPEQVGPTGIQTAAQTREGSDDTIRTLEDMIGETAAEQLRTYVKDGVTKDEITEFLQEQDIKHEESIWKTGTKEEDQLYLLEKQNKMLMVILRQPYGSEETGVKFLFTDIGTEIPESVEISVGYDEW